MTIDRTFNDSEPDRPVSPTAHLLDELQLYGFNPSADEPDPRPLPEAPKIQGALADIFDALVATLNDSRLEPDLPDLLWSVVNVFHRTVERVDRKLDDNERAQRSSQHEQDGSEIRSVELERLLAEGLSLIERRNSFELMRDHAAELYEVHTGHAWRPRAGSLASRRSGSRGLRRGQCCQDWRRGCGGEGARSLRLVRLAISRWRRVTFSGSAGLGAKDAAGAGAEPWRQCSRQRYPIE